MCRSLQSSQKEERKAIMDKKLTAGDEISLSCTWGDGPDVAVNIHFDHERLARNYRGQGFLPLNLTSDEATEIGLALLQAGAQAKELELIAKQMDGEVQ